MTTSRKVNPRELMEMAINVMKQSVPESRSDGKASPLVGVVIRKPDGTIETACRGELRLGDHAEYTLLERKNRSSLLDGAIMFSTLEPCAPGSRRHPKLSCAERIVLARIKEVWVGVEDPDPTVDRKGIRYLQEKGVTVHMFDRDLQEVIRAENSDFMEQARQRAVEVVGRSKKIVLSSLEGAAAAVDVRDFVREALDQYRDRAQIREKVGSEAFNRRLLRQGLLTRKDGELVPTGFGLLVFGREPRTTLPQAGLLGTIVYPDGKEDACDFDDAAVLIPERVEDWLEAKLPSLIDRSRMVREERSAFPLTLIREAVINALVHRDYDISGAKCQLVVTEDKIVVKSPGGPPDPITLEQLQSFSAPMLSRNPELHYVFAQMRLAEERGLGMRTFHSVPEKYHLPLPEYALEDPYLVLTLYRSMESAASGLPAEVLRSLNRSERTGWQFLSLKTTITMREYAEHMGLDHRMAQRHLRRFVELGVLRRVGAGPSTKYRVVRPRS